MPAYPPRVLITGMGLVCSIARNVQDFEQALREGRCGIIRLPDSESHSVKSGALIQNFAWRDGLEPLRATLPLAYARAKRVLNNTTNSTRLSACAAIQAVCDGRPSEPDGRMPEAGLIVGGTNLSQSYIAENWLRFQQTGLTNPRYAFSFFDSNQVGCLSEILSMQGPGCTIGAGAASGNAALFQAFHWIRSGLVKRCLVVGACADFSPLELEAFAILGAASSNNEDAGLTCRPFDAGHQGFVWGQGCGCLLLESEESATDPPHGEIAGVSLLLNGNHLPAPDKKGEIRAMQAALKMAGLPVHSIGYINAHGTSSPKGDQTECAAIKSVFCDHLSGVWINSTKSLTGHCFSASGVIELIACVLQLNGGFAHPNRNLDTPIDSELKLVRDRAEPLSAQYALSNSFGFGGMNSSVVVKKGTFS